MRRKITNPYVHVLYWIFVTLILTLVFGRSWNSWQNALYYISMLLPVVMGTSYLFNFYLVPQLLLKKKYAWFTFYFFNLLVLSLYLQMVVMILSFIYLANFGLSDMNPKSTDIVLLSIVMYLIVFMGSFIVMLQQIMERQKEIELFREEERKRANAFLELVSNRKLVRIPFEEIEYIESLSDYIKIHFASSKSITSKEKISSLAETLPKNFIRIHRSFLVNKQKINRYNANEVEVNGVELNIGRTYKKKVAAALKTI